MITPSSSSEQPQPLNPRAVAALFKHNVEQYFNRWNADKPMRTGYPHASNILAEEHEFCLRKLLLMALYPEKAERTAEKPWSGIENARFKNGWALHEKYQDLLKRYGKVVYTGDEPELDRTHFDEERLLYFSPDAIIDHYGTPMVVEIKGYKAATFEKLDEAAAPPDAAHKQCNLYLHLLELSYGLILVECKDTQQIKCWCVEYNAELAEPFLERLRAFKENFVEITAGRRPLPVRKCSSPTDRLAEKCEQCKFCFSVNDQFPL